MFLVFHLDLLLGVWMNQAGTPIHPSMLIGVEVAG